MRTLSGVDSPWARLPWTLPAAFLVCAAVLWGLAYFLERPARRTAEPPPINARLIEEPAPAATQSTRQERPVAAPKPKPLRLVRPVSPVPLRPSPVQPVRSTPSPPGPAVVERPASSTPVSLPGANLPSGNATSRDSWLPAFETRPSMPPAFSTGTGSAATPPCVGAAYLNNPRPVYPPAARKMGMEGMVMLKVFVSREGVVLKIEISQSSGYEILDKAALEAVKNWRFVPARQGDSPRDEWVQVPVAFVLRR